MNSRGHVSRTGYSSAGNPVLFKTLASQKHTPPTTAEEPLLFRSFLKTEEPSQLRMTKTPRSMARELNFSGAGRSSSRSESQAGLDLQNKKTTDPPPAGPVLFEVRGNPRRSMETAGKTEKHKNASHKPDAPRKKQERQQTDPEDQTEKKTENLPCPAPEERFRGTTGPREPAEEQKKQLQQPRGGETPPELTRDPEKGTQDQKGARNARWQNRKIRKSAEFARIRWSTAHHPAFGWLESTPGAQDLLLPNPNVDPDLAFRMFLSRHWAAAFPSGPSAAAGHSLPKMGWEGVFRSLTVDGVPLGPPTRRQLTSIVQKKNLKHRLMEGNMLSESMEYTIAKQAVYSTVWLVHKFLNTNSVEAIQDAVFAETKFKINKNDTLDQCWNGICQCVINSQSNKVNIEVVKNIFPEVDFSVEPSEQNETIKNVLLWLQFAAILLPYVINALLKLIRYMVCRLQNSNKRTEKKEENEDEEKEKKVLRKPRKNIMFQALNNLFQTCGFNNSEIKIEFPKIHETTKQKFILDESYTDFITSYTDLKTEICKNPNLSTESEAEKLTSIPFNDKNLYQYTENEANQKKQNKNVKKKRKKKRGEKKKEKKKREREKRKRKKKERKERDKVPDLVYSATEKKHNTKISDPNSKSDSEYNISDLSITSDDPSNKSDSEDNTTYNYTTADDSEDNTPDSSTISDDTINNSESEEKLKAAQEETKKAKAETAEANLKAKKEAATAAASLAAAEKAKLAAEALLAAAQAELKKVTSESEAARLAAEAKAAAKAKTALAAHTLSAEKAEKEIRFSRAIQKVLSGLLQPPAAVGLTLSGRSGHQARRKTKARFRSRSHTTTPEPVFGVDLRCAGWGCRVQEVVQKFFSKLPLAVWARIYVQLVAESTDPRNRGARLLVKRINEDILF